MSPLVRLTAAAVFMASAGLVTPAASAQSSASAYTAGFRYDAHGNLAGEIAPDPDGSGALHHAAKRTTYNAVDRPIKVEQGELAAWQSQDVLPSAWPGFTVFTIVEIGYDGMGRKIKEVTYAGSAPTVPQSLTQYSYNYRGLLECTAVRMNPAVFTSTLPAACTLGTEGSLGPDRITRNVYDAAGQRLKEQRAVGTSIQQDYAVYTYSPNGKQTSITDANGNKASMTYDDRDQQLRWYFPSKTTPGSVSSSDYEEYGYDASGNRTTFRKRDGRTFAFTYDALNRATSKIVPEDCVGGYACTEVDPSATRDVYYSYDLRGLQTTARFDSTSGSDAVTNAYDGFGQLTSSTTAMGGVSRTLSYQYDANSKRTRMTYPDGVGNFAYYLRDGLGRAYYADLNTATPLLYFSYDAAGRLQTILRSIGGSWSNYTAYGYDGISRLSSMTSELTGTGHDVTATFAYNPASQVTTRTRNNNAYAFGGYVAVSRSYTANGLNQYATVGGNTYGYDSNGNLTSDGSISYTYDAENRLVVTSTGANLTYDPLGRLYETYKASTGTTRFLYDGDQLTAEYDGSGTMLRRYVHGDGEDDPLVWYEGSGVSSPRYLYGDHQGSIVAITDASGNVTRVNAYDEYGIPNSGNSISAAGRFQYTGQAWIPELGMYHYKARIYSPTLGRFLQTDPIGYDDQVNLYSYVNNDPFNSRDPTGLSDVDLFAKNPHSTDAERMFGRDFDLPGVVTVVGHGTSSGGIGATAKATSNHTGIPINVQILAGAVNRASGGKNQPIALLSCYGAMGGRGS